MVKLGIITSQRFWMDKGGKYYRRSGSLRPILLKAICKYFEKVIIIARIEKVGNKENENMQLVEIPNLEFCHLPSFVWPLGYIHNYRKIKAVMHNALAVSDVVILRSGPGLPYLGFKIARCLDVVSIMHLIGNCFEIISKDTNRIRFSPLRLLLANVVDRQIRFVLSSSDLQAAVSSHTIQSHGMNPDGCTILPNYCFSDNDFYRHSRVSRKKDLPFNCLYVGRLDMIKNVQAFLKAVSQLPYQYSNVSVTIAGNGNYQEALRSLVRELQLSDKVKFLGWVGKREDLQLLYRQADLIFLLSQTEGLPVTLGEAAAASVPAIASNRGGIPEFVQDGYNGYLIEPDDVMSCIDRLIRIIGDTALHESLSRNAFESAQRYHKDQIGQKFFHMVQQALANKNR